MTAISSKAPPGTRALQKRTLDDRPAKVDRWFDRATGWAGLSVLVLLTLVGFFLLLQSREALQETGVWTFLTRIEWRTDTTPKRIGVLGLVSGTFLVAIVAVALAVPLSVGSALFISEYASPRVRRILSGVVDLIAAIPALLFGIWGFQFLSAQMLPVSQWLTDHLGWFPLFSTEEKASFSNSIFITSVVVALMVVPIITSVAREVFAQVPVGEKEAALALGSTKFGMIRTVVLPYGKGGIVGGTMLGMGRALGETMVAVMLLPQVPGVSVHILEYGGATISGFIANRAGSDAFTTSGLMAAGLVLFLITLGTNMVASVVVSRSRSGAGVEA